MSDGAGLRDHLSRLIKSAVRVAQGFGNASFPRCLCVLLLFACGDDYAPSEYTMASGGSRRGELPRPAEGLLQSIGEIGVVEGPDEYVLPVISDAVFGPDGGIIVSATADHRLRVYSPGGRFERWIGRPGSGPGEFVAPQHLAVFDSLLAVYDAGTARVSVFNTSGEFQHAFPVDLAAVEDLFPIDARYIALVGRAQDHRLVVYTWNGQKVGASVEAPVVESALKGRWYPESGNGCFGFQNHLVLVNPWIYEILLIDPDGWAEEQSTWMDDAGFRPVDPFAPDVSPSMTGAFLVGVQCTPELLAVAFVELRDMTIYLDLFREALVPVGRAVFPRSQTGARPGNLGDIRGDTLLAFTAQPYPKVQVFRLVLGPAP